jgi:hypothetical protein
VHQSEGVEHRADGHFKLHSTQAHGISYGTRHARSGEPAERKGNSPMLNLLWALAAIFIILWLLGVSTTVVNLGGLIHILLVLAVISVLARIIMGRRL